MCFGSEFMKQVRYTHDANVYLSQMEAVSTEAQYCRATSFLIAVYTALNKILSVLYLHILWWYNLMSCEHIRRATRIYRHL